MFLPSRDLPDRVSALDSPVRRKILFFGSRFQLKIFIAPGRDHTRPHYGTNEILHHNSGSVRHYGLSKSVWLQADLPTSGVFF